MEFNTGNIMPDKDTMIGVASATLIYVLLLRATKGVPALESDPRGVRKCMLAIFLMFSALIYSSQFLAARTSGMRLLPSAERPPSNQP